MSKKRFNLNRALVVDENFIDLVKNISGKDGSGTINDSGKFAQDKSCGSGEDKGASGDDLDAPLIEGASLSIRDAVELFESQMTSRMMDIVAREMRARNEGFYTIGSSGHEGNAVVGRVTRYTDMAFLHYRSGAFMVERARQFNGLHPTSGSVETIDVVRDTMLGMAACTEDPTSGGRHKVWGSKKLSIPPQTSTIASHLPKSVGAAMALGRANRLGVDDGLPKDAIIVCSFGDASANHATAQTSFNAAAAFAHQQIPTPILFVCEDNGLGISVETPPGWIEKTYQSRYGLKYFQADGLDVVTAIDVVISAVDYCRSRRKPVFLHLKVVRLLGHAGSDPETEYHTLEQIEAAEAKDPLLATARLIINHGVMTPDQVLAKYEEIRAQVRRAAEHAATRPKLTSPAQIMKALAPYSPDQVAAEAVRVPSREQRIEIFGEDRLPENGVPRHMAVLINQGLHDLMIKYPELLVFGEDVAKKGGVYHVTNNLSARFGVGRVFNTMLDETMILAMGIGAGHLGLLPIPEIQYLAYYHNAQDQIRGEASSLQFFSNDQFRNPMVVRMAGWAYQKGFGGHFHNDNSIAALLDVPGLIVASPSRGDDAVKMMRTCVALAKIDGRVVVFIEPIARYMTKDLHEIKDGLWSFKYPPPSEAITLGEGEVYHAEATDLTIITFANGVFMSLQAAKTLREQHDIQTRVVDLRWLKPLNGSLIEEQALATGRVLIVDEGRKTGGLSETIMAILLERCAGRVKVSRLCGLDTFIPLGPAADQVLLQTEDIVTSAMKLVNKPTNSTRPTR